MPELPEVEVSRLGISPALIDKTITQVVIRTPALRLPILPDLPQILRGRVIRQVRRRGKYLLLECVQCRPDALSPPAGWLILHLGMSGSLRFVGPHAAVQKHDHVDLAVADAILRFRDPRRFGVLLWHPGDDVLAHPLLNTLGVEPLTDAFTGRWLHAALAGRRTAIKPALMDAHLVVGVGNIYAAESLFRAGISPRRHAGRIGPSRCERLVAAVRQTLTEAIAAGGSSVRDYIHSDGGAGSFQIGCAVYDRAGLPCRACGHPVRVFRQAGRATYHCPKCQR
jgi:formamidopyrimidine-DNA glycosylase